jgi:predicted secreted protein
MSKYLGNAMLLKLETVANTGTYVDIGGASEHTFTYTNETVEVSDKFTNRWKELLSAGDRMVTITMNGFVTDNAAYAVLESAVETDTIYNYQMAFGNSQILQGSFHVDTNEDSGARSSAQEFSYTFTSTEEPINGALTDFLLDENDANVTDENNQYIQGD